MSAARLVRATAAVTMTATLLPPGFQARRGSIRAAVTMTATLLPPPVTLHSTSPGSRAYSSRLQSSSGIAAGRAAWRRPSSRCTWQAFPCAVWRTSRRHCGAARSRPPPSARGTMKAYTSICPLSDEYSPQGLNNGDVA